MPLINNPHKTLQPPLLSKPNFKIRTVVIKKYPCTPPPWSSYLLLRVINMDNGLASMRHPCQV